MSTPAYTNSANNQNATLSESELYNCRPVKSGNNALRAFCPFHGSDRQRSLRVNLITGYFKCFACDVWGYTAEARDRWKAEHSAARSFGRSAETIHKNEIPQNQTQPTSRKVSPLSSQAVSASIASPNNFKLPLSSKKPEPARSDLVTLLQNYQAALPGSWGEEYLIQRGIPLELALKYGVGYAAAGKWAHPSRDWKYGRVVMPHTDLDGQLINLYGRAVGSSEKVPKEIRHDHLPGDKGYFNATVINGLDPEIKDQPLFVCEGIFDALSLIAVSHLRTIAIIGVNGWRWDWMRNVPRLVFALDADETGQRAWKGLAREAALRGKQVEFLPPEAYGSCKDVNEAWIARKLCLEPVSPENLITPLIRESEVFSRAACSTQQAIYDPRPDLVADSHLWKQLLDCTSRLVGPEIFGALHGLRCCGVQIALRGSNLILVPGELSPEEYVTAWNDCLSGCGKVVDGLLAQIEP
jgi:hypothetical protein